MLFKKKMAEKIRCLEKHQTRRLLANKRIYREGSIQPIQTNYYEKAKDHIKIQLTWIEKLSDMTEGDAKMEGFNSFADFMLYLKTINPKATITEDLEVRAYQFEYLPPGSVTSKQSEEKP